MKPYLLLAIFVTPFLFSTSSCRKAALTHTSVDSMILVRQNMTQNSLKKYKITRKQLLQDTTSFYTTAPPNNFNTLLSNEKHSNVKHILDEVPARLLKENGEFYRNGENIYDCQAYTIYAYSGSSTYSWRFEECTDGMKYYAKEFAKRLNNVDNILHK